MMNMIITPAKKGKGLDDLLSSLDAALPEEVKKVPSSPPSTLSQTLQQYSNFCRQWKRYELVDAREGFMRFLWEEKKVLGSLHRVLTPEEINLALQMIIVNDSKPANKYDGNPGFFTSLHLQHSYDAGYNDFLLDFNNGISRYTYVGTGLDGSGNRTGRPNYRPNSKSLRLTVRGDVGDLFANRARGVDFTVDGTIKGGVGGKDCIFRTANPATGHYLNQHVPLGNKIVRIGLDGTEITVRNFHQYYHDKPELR